MSKRAAWAFVASIAFAVSVAACGTQGPAHWLKGGAPKACYWLSNEGEGWVARPDLETEAQCFEMNGCGHGGNASGGGCYKWAPGKDAPGKKW